ncbi:MAG: hypothetical protein ACK52I_26020 [Pseudomonadota bacterium]|jgi:hypothetical protein
MGYLIKAIPTEIVTAKVTLTSANLLTPGYIFTIPEYPAIDRAFWNVIYMNGEIVNGSTPYVGTSSIHIQTANVTGVQLRFQNTYMQSPVGTWIAAIGTGTGSNTNFATNQPLEIHNPGTLTLGDNDLNIYIGATLIQY